MVIVRDFEIPAGSKTIDAQLTLPDTPKKVPVIVLLTDIRGARPVYSQIAAALADLGYGVVLPNVYYRSASAPVVTAGADFDDETRARLQGYRALLTPEAQAQDFTSLIAGLDATPELDANRIGVVGYCMTGSFALRFAAQYPERVRAAASFHGGQLANEDDPASPALLAPLINARVYIGHADQDASAPPEQIARLDQSLAEAGVAFVTEFYAGVGHGFAIADSAAYDVAASARHLKRLATLFGETLS
ncbi:MAG: dienelactone hydrolase [Sphingomonadales bacterium]|nr:dienelactone hydrolase [Sphingomonadales bacterium]